MDPSIVGSSQFGLLFKTLLPGTWPINGQNVPEQIFSQPLVYTGSDGVQFVYIATTQNNVYKMNAKTGQIVVSRNLHRPFLVSDLDGCVDINPTVGVTATGVIDPDTDTWYLTSKTYIDQNPNGPIGRPNGRYYVHAINTNDLTERQNFPINLEGMTATNNPVRSFNGGIHHQRPGLLHYGQWVYAGFASHCVQYNFTGWIVGWDKTTGKLVEQFATEGSGVPNTVPGAGVWMSGGGLASDDKGSMFFASGNGYASQLNGIPVNGRNPPTSLEEAAVHMAINDDGSLTVVDFFMPWEKTQLDGADKDLGTSPLELLPSQFQCGNITRMGIVTGKSGKTYWLNLDNLGGYQNGPNKLDNVLQVYQNENSVYAGAGVYPLEGGYIYINVIQYQTHVFKFSCNDGVPFFNKIADSPEKNAYILGVGHGTVTSLNDQPGTGLVWTSDVEGSNLRIYNAVPNNGILTEINSFVTPGTTKFTRPVFGDGIVYQGTTLGYIYAYGAPVNLPMNCTSVNFGLINLNSSSVPVTVQCQANTVLTVTAATLSGNPNFVISSLPNFPAQVQRGSNFSFQVMFTPHIVGPLSSSVVLNTTQQAQGFSINTPVQLKGTGQSQAALLSITPNTVSWNGVITGQQIGGVNQSVIINNLGNNVLSINSIQFSVVSEQGPWISPNGTSHLTIVSAFTFYDLPAVVPANNAVTVPINFNPPSSGNYAVYVCVNTNAGSQVFDVIATGSDVPVAVLEFQSPDNSWVKYDNTTSFSFGNVTEGTSRYLKLRLSNDGTSNAAAISVTVSKPPFGIPGSIIGASNQVDLAEGTLVYAGQSLTATLYCSVPKSQINVAAYNGTAQWTMNLNDLTFGKQYIQFLCNAVAEQAPPLDPFTQQGLYHYAGCFTENNPGRQLQTNIYSGSNNSNEACIAQCYAAGYIFAGTQYNQECWCGFNRPKTVNPDINCNYPCTGNVNEICGGNGANGGGAFISVFGDITRWNGNSTDTPGPYINPGSFGYSSIGCYTEGSQGRALSVQPQANITVSSCLQACQGYLYSGVEYGGQCFCGNTIAIGSVNTSASDCSMTCNNNQTEYCGGPSRLNMYVYGNGSLPAQPTTSPAGGNPNPPGQTGLSIPSNVGSFSYLSCYTEGTNGRALIGKALADDSLTLQTCASDCSAFQYFGAEYGRECYCGNSLSAGSIQATDGRCNMGCAGNTSLACGGPNGLQLYRQANFTSSSTTTSPATPTPSVTIVPIAGSFGYQDCHTEATNGRALTGFATASNDMTIQYCAGNCSGFTYMAVEYGRECYCGNSLAVGSVTATDGRCSMVCAGNPYNVCGGPNGLSLYQFLSANATGASTSTTTIFTHKSTTTSSIIGSTTITVSQISSFTSSSAFLTTISSISSFKNSSTTTSFQSLTPTSTSGGILGPNTTLSTSPIPSTSGSSSISFGRNVSTTTTISTTYNSSSPIPSMTSTSSSTSGDSLSTIARNVSSSSSTASFSPGSNLTSPTTSSTTSASSTVSSRITSSSTSSVPVSTLSSSLSSGSSILASTLSSTSRLSSGTSNIQSTLSTTRLATTTTSLSNHPTPSSPWIFLGCANETSPRALSQASTTSNGMTIELCTTYCASKNLPLAGLEYSRGRARLLLAFVIQSELLLISLECYCGLNLSNNSTLGFSGCSMACNGNSSETCGGPSRLSVYNNTAFNPPAHRPTISNYTFTGCYIDTNPRILNGYSFSATNMTEDLCVRTCASKGYRYAGTEFASQCFCGTTLSNGAGQANVQECNMLCNGDASQFCGGPSRLSIWNGSGT